MKRTCRIITIGLSLFIGLSIRSFTQSVSIWQTLSDGSQKFQSQTAKSFATGTAGSTSITLNESTTYQTIDGFGWTLTEGSCEALSSLGSTQQSAILNDLFNTSTGLGVSVLRISIGASDLSATDYTYQDGGSSSAFSLSGPDLTYLIPILKKIIAINPNIKLLATPWTAPRWMKSNNAWVGGNLNTTYYSAYATYFKNYLDAMKAQGITIWAICPQNEPGNATNEPSMTLTSTEELNFINNNLGPTIRNAGYSTKIICYDHNCDNTDFPTTVCNGSSYVDGAAFHLYAGSISALTTVHNNTGKNVYFTEQYTGTSGSFSGDFPWHMQNVMLGTVNNWGKVALEWNLATNSSFGPHTPGGCSSCLGAYTINSSTSYTQNVSYYLIAHLAKVVKPNAVRIGTSASNGNLINAAFVNSDGSRSLVVYNNTGSSSTFDVAWNGSKFSYTLPAGGAVSFIWTAGSTVAVTGVTVSPTSASIAVGSTQQLTATISPSNATNKNVTWTSGNTGIATVSSSGLVTGVSAGSAVITVTTADGARTATCTVTVTGSTSTNLALNKPTTVSSTESSSYPGSYAVDGNTSTRWSSAFSDPQWIYVDLGGTYAVNRVKVTWEAAYATAYQIQISTDASSWTTLKSITGNTSLTNDNTGLSGTGRYVRIYGTTRATAYGYSIFELEVYGTTGTTVAVTGVTVSPTTASIGVGVTQQLTATVSPSNATNKNVTWTSNNTGVATVSSSGLVTGVAAGSATITVTTADGAKTATCAITVTSTTVIPTGVTVSPTSATIGVGATQQLTATVSPSNATNKNVTWTSNNTGVATVSSSGLVTGVAAGTATITVTTVSGSKTATCSITISATSTFPGYYNIFSVLNPTKGLDVANNSTSSGAYIQQYTVTSGGGSNQRWRLDDAGNGYYYIKVKSTQMCLATLNAGTGNGTQVIQQTCNSSTSQMWKLSNLGGGVYEITLYNTTQALDVKDVSTSDGASIQIWAYGGGNNQKWTFTQVEATKGTSMENEPGDEDNTDLQVYPSPADNFIIIKLSSLVQYNALEILTIKGSTVCKQLIPEGAVEVSVNIDNLENGIYFIKITGNTNSVVKRFIKQ